MGGTHGQGGRGHRGGEALVDRLEGGCLDPSDAVHNHVPTHGACGKVKQEVSTCTSGPLLSTRPPLLPAGMLVPVTDVLMVPVC